MKYFALFLGLAVFFTVTVPSIAHAELDSSILGPFSDNDIVVVGTVVQIIADGNTTRYDIKVEESLKGQLSFDLITATLNQVKPSDFPQSRIDYYNKPFFEKDNQVLVYLKQEGGTLEMSPFSFTIKKPFPVGPPSLIHPTSPQEHINSQGDEIIISGTVKKGYLYGLAESDLDSDFNLVVLDENEEQVESKKLTISPDGIYSFTFQDRGELRIPGKYSWDITYHNGRMGGEFFVTADLLRWTPLKQFKSGIVSDEIRCKENLVLIQKYDGSPACVTESTKTKLIERGWTENPVKINTTIKPIPYDPMFTKKITESTPKWKIPEELEKVGCSDAMVIHLKKYSNAFDEKWNGKSVAIEDIGLPWGVHQYALDECMQNISELRNNEN